MDISLMNFNFFSSLKLKCVFLMFRKMYTLSFKLCNKEIDLVV